MKKKSVAIFAGVLFIFHACGSSETTPAPEILKDTIVAEEPAIIVEEVQEEIFVQQVTDASRIMLGSWTGEMSGKKLTIVIEKIDGNEIFGYNTLGSTRRDLTGTFEDASWDQPCTKAFEAVLNEPGDDEWDGVFTIKFVGYQSETETEDGDLECIGNYTGSEGMGKWKPNNGKASKDFTLTKNP